MTIIEKIKKSIECATHLQFYYDDRDALNTILDDAEFPCVVSHLVEQGAISDELGVFHERLTMEVWFEDLACQDANGIQNEQTIDQMKRLALAWLTSLRINQDIKLVSINSTGRHYLDRDVMTTGYAVTITFDEVDGFSKCDI